jgi:hypothetical protein
MAISSLSTQLAAGLADPANQLLIQSILGTSDAELISQTVQELCKLHLGQSITEVEFWEVSVSLTVGLRLGRDRVVVKFRSPNNITLETLQTVCQIQQGLSEQGFPAPRLVLMPMSYANCLMSVEQLLDQGENCDAHDPIIRRAMAHGLAEQIRLAESFQQLNLPRSRFHPTQLWEKPHNALFDFANTRRGAEWIDAIAAEAQAILQSYDAPLVVGHMDWSAKNMRFQNGRLSAVYDWDSLRLENELVIVGNAAKGFLATWYVEVGARVPTPEEVHQFIRDYEIAKGQAFTTADLRVITAAFIYSMAYTARCEHAIDPTGQKLNGSFRTALRNPLAYGFNA